MTGQECSTNNILLLVLRRVLEEHRNFGELFLVDGCEWEKEGRGFGRLPSFFFRPFLLVSYNR